MTQPAPSRMDYPRYLALEASSETKHEYLRGDVYAMAGGTPEHAALAAAIAGELRNQLRGRPCRVFSSDMRVRIETTDLTTYPDLTVVCGHLERSAVDELAVVNPTLIVEVLSEGTEAYDRGKKFAHYRRLPALKEYVLVSHTERRLEAYRKDGEGRWVLFEARSGEKLELGSLPGVMLDTDEVYRNPLTI